MTVILSAVIHLSGCLMDNGKYALPAGKFSFSQFFPPLIWTQGYNQEVFVKDFFAALIVVIMLVPQALGYALVAGMPPYIGLYVSILPPLLYCLFGTSMFLSVGVCAIIAILTKSGASLIGPAGSPEHIAAGAALALMAGGMLILMDWCL